MSLVLRNSPLVARTTRARVQSPMGCSAMSTTAPLLISGARLTHTIGLIVCEITNPFYAELTAGIDEVQSKATRFFG